MMDFERPLILVQGKSHDCLVFLIAVAIADADTVTGTCTLEPNGKAQVRLFVSRSLGQVWLSRGRADISIVVTATGPRCCVYLSYCCSGTLQYCTASTCTFTFPVA